VNILVPPAVMMYDAYIFLPGGDVLTVDLKGQAIFVKKWGWVLCIDQNIAT